jgi:cystathionine beta-lyase
MRTLSLRLDRHQASADADAAWLVQQDAVERVLYPGLPDHPGHAAWQRDASGTNGLVSVIFRPGFDMRAFVLEDLGQAMAATGD